MAYKDVVLEDKPLVYYRMDTSEAGAEGDHGSLGLEAIYHGTVAATEGAIRDSSIPALETSPTLETTPTLETSGGGPDQAALFVFNTNNYLLAPPNATLNGLAEHLTMEVWVKPSEAHLAGILMERHVAEPGSLLFASRLFMLLGKYALVFQKPDESEPALNVGEVVIGAWSHVVGTYDGEAQRLFHNGVVIGEKPLTGAIRTELGETIFGARLPGPTFPLDGSLDEVAIYDHALSQPRIEAHYLAGRKFEGPLGRANPLERSGKSTPALLGGISTPRELSTVAGVASPAERLGVTSPATLSARSSPQLKETRTMPTAKTGASAPSEHLATSTPGSLRAVTNPSERTGRA